MKFVSRKFASVFALISGSIVASGCAVEEEVPKCTKYDPQRKVYIRTSDCETVTPSKAPVRKTYRSRSGGAY